MLDFNWNSVDDSTFQGQLSKYTNAFKGFQSRYFILDAQKKTLLYFVQDEVRKKGPRGAIELTDCYVLPSEEDDVTFSVHSNNGEIFKLKAADAKERQKWIGKLRTYAGSNAANAYSSSLPVPKSHQSNNSSSGTSPKDTHDRRRAAKSNYHRQTLHDLEEMIRCAGINQQEFVDVIDAMPDDVSIHPLSKTMLLLRSISHSCVSSLEDSLAILSRERTLSNGIPHLSTLSSSSPSPTSKNIKKQSSPLLNSSTSAKSTGTVGLSPPSTSVVLPNRNSN